MFHSLSRSQLSSDSLEMNNKAFGLSSFGGAAGRGYSPTTAYRHNVDPMRRQIGQMPAVSLKALCKKISPNIIIMMRVNI